MFESHLPKTPNFFCQFQVRTVEDEDDFSPASTGAFFNPALQQQLQENDFHYLRILIFCYRIKETNFGLHIFLIHLMNRNGHIT